MNGTRAEVPLPFWVRRLLAWLVRLRLRLGGLEMGLTEAGWIFAGSVAGAWAAATSSGNNLLVLAAALGTGVLIAAFVEGLRMLRAVPTGSLAGTWLVPPASAQTRPLARLPAPGRVQIKMPKGLHAEIVDDGTRAWLSLRAAPAAPRGVYRLRSLICTTAAPAGIFVLARTLPARLEIVVPPGMRAPALHPLRARFGMDFEDLQRYAPGEPLARVHWRRAAGRAPEQWLVKRFHDEELTEDAALTVDLRLHGKSPEDLEALLAEAWALVQRPGMRRIRVGEKAAELGQGILPAARLLAQARAQNAPPPVVEGRLLSLAGP